MEALPPQYLNMHQRGVKYSRRQSIERIADHTEQHTEGRAPCRRIDWGQYNGRIGHAVTVKLVKCPVSLPGFAP